MTAMSEPGIEPITGRYLHLEVDGRRHRIYFEEAGSGIPLLCLHTAAADGRQYRHLMNDEAITSRFRVIAFDMPRHGRSNPPDGWENEDYRLSSETYIATIRTFCAALALDRPVVMGCSISGRIVLNLAARHGGEFRALIGLDAAASQTPWYDPSWLNRPDVDGGLVAAGIMSGLVAPQSPPSARWETLWPYMQAAPGVLVGDIYFYRADGDLSSEVTRIDARRTPLFLLTGAYDHSCTPADTLRTAELIPGCKVTVMEGIGHFAMIENPEKFRTYILPILDEIAGGN